MSKYNWHDIENRRAQHESWESIASTYGVKPTTLRGAYSRWRQKPSNSLRPRIDERDNTPFVQATFTKDDIARITSLDDLLTFFEVDTEAWEVRDYRVNKWEQASKRKDGSVQITPLYQVRANLIRRIERQVDVARQIVVDLLADAETHMPPAYEPLPIVAYGDEGVLFELALFDAHIGMLAWGKEVGRPYDLDIAVRDYGRATAGLLSAAPETTERILYVVGNDFLHVDHAGMNTRGGATTAGTPQDVDTRLAKMFTAGRRALVSGIDQARLIAPVDVIVVPGNHDQEQTYRMGEVLHAWYRNDPEVNIIYGARKRKFYRWGENGFMFTHGEEYRRTQRDNLPLIFATSEDGREAWDAKVREIHTGHSHVSMGGRYVPTADQTETRAVRTRSLPGLTATDAWHYVQGYQHMRAGTALVYRKSGGLVSLHEFNDFE